MSKLRLNLEDIAVESFEVTSSGGSGRGTVRGHGTLWPECQQTQGCITDGGCLNTFGCDTAYCNPSQQLACPTATCHDGCTADCPGYPAQTWNQTCPATCDWACGSGGGSACAT